MRCPFCDFIDTQVKDSRPAGTDSIIKRRRYCQSCGGKFTTLERVETKEIKVLKRNGEKRPFDNTKLLNSLEIATRKRPVTSEQLEAVLSIIIKQLEKSCEGEVSSSIIGQLVMNELTKVDQVAYIRYASVYKDFHTISDFSAFIKGMITNVEEEMSKA